MCTLCTSFCSISHTLHICVLFIHVYQCIYLCICIHICMHILSYFLCFKGLPSSAQAIQGLLLVTLDQEEWFSSWFQQSGSAQAQWHLGYHMVLGSNLGPSHARHVIQPFEPSSWRCILRFACNYIISTFPLSSKSLINSFSGIIMFYHMVSYNWFNLFSKIKCSGCWSFGILW